MPVDQKRTVKFFRSSVSPLTVKLTLCFIEEFISFFDDNSYELKKKQYKATKHMSNNVTFNVFFFWKKNVFCFKNEILILLRDFYEFEAIWIRNSFYSHRLHLHTKNKICCSPKKGTN